MSTAAVPTVMAALSSNARGAPLALTACRLRRIQLSMGNAKYVSTRRQAVQLWLSYAINCFWEIFCMESLLEAEVPGMALIYHSSTADRHGGQRDVRLDEPAGRAKLVNRCVKLFLGEILQGAAPRSRGVESGIDRPQFIDPSSTAEPR